MLLGATRELRELVQAVSAVTLDSPTCTVYDSAGSTAASGVATIDNPGTTEQTLNFAFAAPAAGIYYAVFRVVADGNPELFEQRVVVESMPPGAGGYPRASDLQAFLEAASLTLSAALLGQLENAVDGAIRDFERATGRVFVAATATRRRDPPVNWQDARSILRLGSDLVSDDPAAVAVVYTPTGNTAETLVYGTDYDFGERESECQEKGWPWREVRFYRRWAAPLSAPYRRSLYLTGPWGYGSSVPADVWGAVLAGGALRLASQIGFGLRAGLVSWTEADVTRRYSEDPLKALRETWGGADGTGGQYGRAVKNYRLV